MKKTFTYLLGGVLCALFLIPSSAEAQITAKWDWENNIPGGIRTFTAIQNNTGTIESNVAGISMFVDATSGKLGPNGGTPQFVAGTILRVPVVSTLDVVTIKCYPGSYTYYVKINATEYTTQTTAYTPNAADVAKGYVEILSGCEYLYSVIADLAYLPPTKTIAKWDWKNTAPATISSVSLEQYSGDPVPVASDVSGISMDFVSGKLVANGDNAQFNSGTILRVPVTSISDVVTVYCHPSGFAKVTIGGIDYNTQKTDYTATAADVTQGYVEVVSGGGYLYSITLTKGNYSTTTIGSTGWATFSNSQATDFTGVTVNAKIVTGVSGSALTMTDVTGTAAANTGLLLNADEGTYAIPLTTTGTDYSSTNKLVAGTGADVNYNSGAGYNYVLAKNGGVAVFQRIVEGTYGSVTVAKGKAYLALAGDPGAHELSLDFSGGGSTDIQFTKNMGQSADGVYYNLAGQRVAQPTKGLYIVNGKKVIVK